jgi:DNA-binding FadR family transcriptional regulator
MNTNIPAPKPEILAQCIAGIRKNIDSGRYPQGSDLHAEALKAIEILTAMEAEAKARKG